MKKERNNNMLEWHDCKSDPPKRSGRYILVTSFYKALFWEAADWDENYKKWKIPNCNFYNPECCYKWAEVELLE